MKRGLGFTIAFILLLGTSAHAEETDKLYVSSRVIEKKWTNFNLEDVRLSEGSYFKKMQDIHLNYLLSLDPERLMNNVLRGGDIATTAENYGGWQHDSGNGFGNYMSGCSMMYASTGDERLLERVKWMIDNIADCQERENLDGFFYFGRSKGAASYNALMSATNNGVDPSNNGEDFYTNSAMAGMAFYQLHRIFYGIRDVYYYTQYEKAKDVFIKCMEWACKWTDLITDDSRLQMALEAEHGGMMELFVDAYALTGNKRFLDNAERWIHSLNFRDKMADNIDVLTSRHANVYDPKYIGLIRDYEFTGNEQNRDAALNTWNTVVNKHVLSIGGHGSWERYGEPGKLLDKLANTSTETCCTNNMLRFTKAMFSVFGDTKYMDFYERALYNHILASKDPDCTSIGGGFCYYQSLMPGQHRKYMDDNSFYCCWETGLENHSKYGEAIYFHNDNDILVNLYIPSVLEYKDKGFSMKQEGNYPSENTITLSIAENRDFTGDIQFRCPQWMNANGVQVSINGEVQNIDIKAGEFFSVSHDWKSGDIIKITLPIELRYEPSEEPNVGSLFYGPLVIVPNLGTVSSGDYVSNVWNQSDDSQAENFPDFPHFDNSKENLSSWISRQGDALEFVAKGIDQTYNFVPFYAANHMKTSICQRFVGKEDLNWERDYVTDRIIFNVNETEHSYRGRASLYTNYSHYYRHVAAKRFLSYTMKVSEAPDVQHWIAVKHYGWETEDVGNYDVYVDDVLIDSMGSCKQLKQFTYPTCFFKIPKDLTNGKSAITVKFLQKDCAMNYYGIEVVTDKYLKEFYPETKYTYESPRTVVRLEAEAAQPHGGNRTFDGKSSSGAYVSRLSSYLQFNNVVALEDGTYELSICYRGSAKLQYYLTTNGVKTQISLPATNGDWSVQTFKVDLREGFNTINLAPVSVRNPYDVDYIELNFDKTSSIGEVKSDQRRFLVYPNPCSDYAFFKTVAGWQGNISVRDVQGHLVSSFEYPGQDKFGVSGCADGMYIVSFDNGKDTAYAKLVVRK